MLATTVVRPEQQYDIFTCVVLTCQEGGDLVELRWVEGLRLAQSKVLWVILPGQIGPIRAGMLVFENGR